MGYMFTALIGSVIIFFSLAAAVSYEEYKNTEQLAQQGELQQAEFINSLNNAVISWLQNNASSCTNNYCVINYVCYYLESQTNSQGQPYYVGSCESPLGEETWTLVYNAQGNYELFSNNFDPEQFARYFPNVNPYTPLNQNTTMADKILSDALIKHPLQQGVEYKGVLDVQWQNGAINSTQGINTYTSGSNLWYYFANQLGFNF